MFTNRLFGQRTFMNIFLCCKLLTYIQILKYSSSILFESINKLSLEILVIFLYLYIVRFNGIWSSLK